MVQPNTEIAAGWPLAVPSTDPSTVVEPWWSVDHLVSLWPHLVVPACVGIMLVILARQAKEYEFAPIIIGLSKIIESLASFFDAIVGFLIVLANTLGLPYEGMHTWINNRSKRTQQELGRDKANDVIDTATKLYNASDKKMKYADCLEEAKALHFGNGEKPPEIEPGQPPHLRQVN